jgi:hypothetical protein
MWRSAPKMAAQAGAAFSTPHNKVIKSASHPSGWPTPCRRPFHLPQGLGAPPSRARGSRSRTLSRALGWPGRCTRDLHPSLAWAHVVGNHKCVCRDRLRDKSHNLREMSGCRHQRGPSALAGSARADGLPALAVAIVCYVAFKNRHSAWAATCGAERRISTAPHEA